MDNCVGEWVAAGNLLKKRPISLNGWWGVLRYVLFYPEKGFTLPMCALLANGWLRATISANTFGCILEGEVIQIDPENGDLNRWEPTVM